MSKINFRIITMGLFSFIIVLCLIVSSAVEAATFKVTTNSLNLNLRASIGNGQIIAKMPTGSIVEGEDLGNGWARVTYNGITGYATMQYLTMINNGDNNSSIVIGYRDFSDSEKSSYSSKKTTKQADIYNDPELRTHSGLCWGVGATLYLSGMTSNAFKVEYNYGGTHHIGWLSKDIYDGGNSFQQYTKTAMRQAKAYATSSLNSVYGNEWVDKGDVVTVLEEASNAYKVRYPVSNGYKERWVSKDIFESEPPPSDDQQQIHNKMVTLSGTSGYRVGTKYTGSGQCRGFANKIYQNIFYGVSYISGYSSNNYAATSYNGSYIAGRLYDFSTSDTNAVKNLFMSAKVGAFVQMGRRYTLNSTKTAPSPHSAIVYSIQSDGVEFYEANTDGKNTIKINKYTWAALADRNKGFTIYLPNSYR